MVATRRSAQPQADISDAAGDVLTPIRRSARLAKTPVGGARPALGNVTNDSSLPSGDTCPQVDKTPTRTPAPAPTRTPATRRSARLARRPLDYEVEHECSGDGGAAAPHPYGDVQGLGSSPGIFQSTPLAAPGEHVAHDARAEPTPEALSPAPAVTEPAPATHDDTQLAPPAPAASAEHVEGHPTATPVQTTVTPASIQIGATPAADDTTPSYAHALLSLAPETVSQPDFADAGNASDNVYSGALVFGSNTGAEGPEFVVDVPAEGALMLLEALESIEEPVHTQGRTLAADASGMLSPGNDHASPSPAVAPRPEEVAPATPESTNGMDLDGSTPVPATAEPSRTPATVIRAFDRLRLTTPGGTPIPAAPTASQVVAQVPVLDVAVDANPAPADDFTFSAPETGAAVPPSPTAPALTPLALPVLSPTGATEGPCESAPGTPTHKLSARPPANTPMGSAAGAAVASLDMKTLRSKLGVEPSPAQSPIAEEKTEGRPAQRRLKSAVAVCSPFADADGQVKVSPSLRQLKRQVREAMEMREKAAELRHLRFGEDGAVVARTPGRAAVMLGRSGAPSADADLYVHMADAEMAFADECCAWCGAEECECEDEMCDGTMDGLSHAVASLAVDRAASGMAGLPKFEGQHLRFDDDGRALPAGGSSKLNGLPTPKGKHIVFDD